MKKLAIISSAVIGLLYAADTVPNNFTSGEIIKASEINANFDHLSNLITQLRSQIETLSNSSGQRKFVGLSSSTVLGTVGTLTVNETCNQDYPGSTICTQEDIYNSSSAMDATGSGLIELTSCNTFTSTNYSATAISFPSGKRTFESCNVPNHIACCK